LGKVVLRDVFIDGKTFRPSKSGRAINFEEEMSWELQVWKWCTAVESVEGLGHINFGASWPKFIICNFQFILTFPFNNISLMINICCQMGEIETRKSTLYAA